MQTFGKKVIVVCWININKGDTQRPDHRPCIVANDCRTKYDCHKLFYAVTLPIEAVHLIRSHAATFDGTFKHRRSVMVNDVERAYFYAIVNGDIFVEFPPEDKSASDKELHFIGRLNLSLYGTREAAAAWQSTVTHHFSQFGFKVSSVNPCVHSHLSRDIQVLVHGDNYLLSGRLEDFQWFRKQFEDKFELKTSILGPSIHSKKELRVLNRVV